MKNMYYSKPSAGVLRLSGMILGMVLLFQTVLAAAIAPSIENQQFPVQENASNGTQIGLVQAAGAVSYHIMAGNEQGVFVLNESTGELTVSDNSVLDYETNPSFSLTVEVKDAEGVASQATVLVQVQNLDEPVAVTGGISNITENGASLTGSFETGGAATVAAIQYGADAVLPAFDPEGAEGSVSAAPEETANEIILALSELQDGTTYYYRTVAKNSEGTVYGDTKSFTTLSIPWVESVTIRDPNPTNAEVLTFLVTFSEAVNNVDIADFYLQLIPVDGKVLNANITDVAAQGETGREYIVTISDVSGDGTIRLDFVDNESVESVNGVNVGGAGATNGNFEEGEIYTVDNTSPGVLTLIYTNEDVSARHFFAVTNDPDSPEDLTVSFVSSNPNVIGNDSYEITRNSNRWEIRMFPTEHVHGETTITINVIDGAGNPSQTIELLVIVRAVADAPLLVANNVEGDEDTAIPLDVAASLVDQDGSESLTQIKISGVPTGAALSAGTFVGSGTYTFADAAALQAVEFIPENNIFGVYDLTLEATAEESATGDMLTKKTATATKTFTVTVNSVNDEPVFALDPAALTLEEDFTTEEFVKIIPGDVPADEAAQVVSYSVSVKTEGEAPIATVVVGQDENGKPRLKITSIKDATGTQVFTVVANDGQGPDNNSTYERDFTLTITPENDEPAFAIDLDEEVQPLKEDFEPIEIGTINPSAVPGDEEGQSITYNVVVKNEGEEAIATISVVEVNGVLRLKAESIKDANGTQVFTVTANDGQTANNFFTQDFTLTIDAVNDEPVFALDPTTLTLEEDFTTEEYVAIVPGDVPADEAEQVVSYSVGVKTEGEAPIATVVVGQDENGKPRLEITAIKDANGTQIFTVVANDGQGPDNHNTFAQDFTLIITPVNDSPTFELSSYEVVKDEDFEETVAVNLTNTSPEDEGEAITYSLDPAPETVGLAQVSFDESTGTITIVSVSEMYGRQDFVVTAHDGELSETKDFTLIVNPVNDAPQFSIDRTEIIVEEDFTTTETVTPTLVHPFPYGETNESVQFSLNPASVDFANVSIDPETGIVSITAVQDKNGEQVFEIIATDNGQPAPASAVKTFLLRVVPVSDSPVLGGELADQTINEDEAYEYAIPAGVFTDPDGDETLSFTASLVGGAALPAWLSFDADTRTFSGTPLNDDTGTYEILVVATDDTGEEVSDSFTLTVVPVNDVPVISEIADVSIQLGDEVPAIAFTISDEETPANELVVTAVSDDGVFLPASAISISGEGENRTLVLSPLVENFGKTEITVTVSDGENEAVERFAFEIVFRELALDVPTLITPNGDGANDTWNIRYLSLYDDASIRVFDRTGRLVFQSQNYLSGPEWDGTLGGNELPEGVYYYEIKLKGGEMSKKGTLTIAR